MGASARGFIVAWILFAFLVLGIVVVGPGLSLPGGAVEMPKVMSGRPFFPSSAEARWPTSCCFPA